MPASVHEQFAKDMAQALSLKPIGSFLIGGCDLNTRVAETPPDVTIVGPWASRCPHKAQHAHPLLRVLQHNSVHLANTFLNTKQPCQMASELLCSDDIVHLAGEALDGMSDDDCSERPHSLTEAQAASIVTWPHPQSKKQFQIDFIMACPKALSSICSCHTMSWACFDLLTSSDHRAVTASFLFTSTQDKKAGGHVMRHHKSPEHLEAFKTHLAGSIRAFTPDSHASPFEVTQQLQKLALDSLSASKPKKATPKQEWISSSTWAVMRTLHSLRKIIKARKHHASACNLLLPLSLPWVKGASCQLAFPFDLNEESWDHVRSLIPEYIRALTKH
eukprot:4304577-Amphidinium_carterae.1